MDKKEKIALGGLALAFGYGVYSYFNISGTGMPKDLKIVSYENTNTHEVQTSPALLNVQKGESVKVNFEYKYRGPGFAAKYYAELIKDFDNMESEAEKEITIDGSDTWVTHEDSLVLATDLAMKPDVYALRITIQDAPWGEDISAFLISAVAVLATPQAEDFEIISCTADKEVAAVGETVTLTAEVKNLTDTDFRLIAIRFHVREENSFPGTGYHGEYFFNLPLGGLFVAGGTATVSVSHIVEEQSTPDHVMRDVYVSVWHMIPGDEYEIVTSTPEFYSVYEVAKAEFAISDLLVNPTEGLPGTVFGLHFTIINNSGGLQSGEVELMVRQGEWVGTGVVLDTPPRQQFDLGPGQSVQFNFQHVGTKTHTGDDEENERDVDVNVYVGGELIAERDWRYNADGFHFLIIDPVLDAVTVQDITVVPAIGPTGTLFNINTVILNQGSSAELIDLQLDIQEFSTLQFVESIGFNNINIQPGTSIAVPMQWRGNVGSGFYNVIAKVYQGGVELDKFTKLNGIIINNPEPEIGSFGLAPYSWPDLFPYPEATHWGAIWMTGEGDFSTGILPRSQMVHMFSNVPLVGQLVFSVYIDSIPGFVESYGPTAEAELEDGGAYWYRWDTNELVRSS